MKLKKKRIQFTAPQLLQLAEKKQKKKQKKNKNKNKQKQKQKVLAPKRNIIILTILTGTKYWIIINEFYWFYVPVKNI